MNFKNDYNEIEKICSIKLREIGKGKSFLLVGDLVSDAYVEFADSEFTNTKLGSFVRRQINKDSRQVQHIHVKEEWQYEDPNPYKQVTNQLTKICTKCNAEKPIEEFRKKDYKDSPNVYINSSCRACESKRQIAYVNRMSKNPEWKKEHYRKQKKKHREYDRDLRPCSVKQMLINSGKYSREFINDNPVHILYEINRLRSSREVKKIIRGTIPIPIPIKIKKLASMANKKIKNMKDLVNDLVSTYEDLGEGKITVEQASATSKVAGTIIQACKMQLEYNYMRKTTEPIEFLETVPALPSGDKKEIA